MRIHPYLILMLFLAAPAAADIYKWTDSQGKVHYSDIPPEGRAARSLGATQDREADAQADASRKALADKLSESERRRQETEKAEEKRQAEAEQARKRQEACQRARDRMNMLQQGGRIAKLNAQGERYLMDDAERMSQISSLQQQIAEFCR